MTYVRESLEDKNRVELKDATWNDVKPPEKDPADKRWSPNYTNMPFDAMSSLQINNEEQFNRWKAEFIKYWGSEGTLVKWSQTSWKLEGNEKMDASIKRTAEDMDRFYGRNEKRGPIYTGD